jgi:hypothetical protein
MRHVSEKVGNNPIARFVEADSGSATPDCTGLLTVSLSRDFRDILAPKTSEQRQRYENELLSLRDGQYNSSKVLGLYGG